MTKPKPDPRNPSNEYQQARIADALESIHFQLVILAGILAALLGAVIVK